MESTLVSWFESEPAQIRFSDVRRPSRWRRGEPEEAGVGSSGGWFRRRRRTWPSFAAPDARNWDTRPLQGNATSEGQVGRVWAKGAHGGGLVAPRYGTRPHRSLVVERRHGGAERQQHLAARPFSPFHFGRPGVRESQLSRNSYFRE